MKYIRTSKDKADIEIVFEISEDALVKDTLKANILSRLPEEYRTKVFFADFSGYDKFKKVPELPNVKLVVSRDSRWTKYLPHVDYSYDSKALYLTLPLEALEAAISKVTYFLEHGSFPITQKPRKGFYPSNPEEVEKVFKYLHTFKEIGADIESTSLKFYKANLVSISFAISEVKGFTFHVKKCDFISHMIEFFKTYQGKIIWHNGSYDIKVLAYLYFNSDSRELYRTFEDTMFLHFLCTNSPERPTRTLGELAKPLCGEYKLTKAEIEDMMNVPVKKVCEYNLDDSRATLWIYHQYRSRIHSESLYEKFKLWQWLLTQMELQGLPYRKDDLQSVTATVKQKLAELKLKMMANPLVDKVLDLIRVNDMEKYNATHVGDKELWEIKKQEFKSTSPKQMAMLFEKVIGVKSPLMTKTGKPSYGVKAYPHLKLLIDNNPDAIELMDLLEEYSGYNQLLVTFLAPMLGNSKQCGEGRATLHGSFNLARVVSGRLSSSEPNLTNLPSKGALGKLFKSIISPPEGWRMGGADYASQEERVNTILTQDPNKKKVYLDGFDGHSFRALYYFPEHLTHIQNELDVLATDSPDYVKNQVEIINDIKITDGEWRDASKPITFALQYLGTAYTLRLQCGLSAEKALEVERSYHEVYVKSDEWLQSKLEEAAEKGYAEVAYGLRIYCAGVSKSILNSKYTPSIIRKHIRTLGNAIAGQSYGQMTVDAAAKFLLRVYEADLQDRVGISALVHDAIYAIWEDDVELTKWVNDNLIECMEDISELPELAGDISIPADLEIFSPAWSNMIGLPRFGSLEEIQKVLT